MRLGAAHHALAPPIINEALIYLGSRAVEAVERARGDIEIELRPIGREGRAISVEYFDRCPAGVGFLLDHDGRNRLQQDSLGDPSRLGTRYIMRDLAASSTMADVDCVLQVKRVCQVGNVGRISVHLIATVGLVRSSMTTAIVGNNPETLVQEKQHLIVPLVRAQRPSMVEDDRLCVFRSPVLVEDTGAVFGGDGAHASSSSRGAGQQGRRWVS